jgi:hypothetical protein
MIYFLLEGATACRRRLSKLKVSPVRILLIGALGKPLINNLAISTPAVPLLTAKEESDLILTKQYNELVEAHIPWIRAQARKRWDKLNPRRRIKRTSDLAAPRPARANLILSSLRVATTRSRLITNIFDTMGVALRQKQIDCAGALAWLKDEGILGHLPFAPGGRL